MPFRCENGPQLFWTTCTSPDRTGQQGKEEAKEREKRKKGHSSPSKIAEQSETRERELDRRASLGRRVGGQELLVRGKEEKIKRGSSTVASFEKDARVGSRPQKDRAASRKRQYWGGRNRPPPRVAGLLGTRLLLINQRECFGCWPGKIS